MQRSLVPRPLPDFSPRLWDEIWEWSGDEATYNVTIGNPMFVNTPRCSKLPHTWHESGVFIGLLLGSPYRFPSNETRYFIEGKISQIINDVMTFWTELFPEGMFLYAKVQCAKILQSTCNILMAVLIIRSWIMDLTLTLFHFCHTMCS